MRVRQRTTTDCAIASVATLLGISYEEAQQMLPPVHDGGLYAQEVADAIGRKWHAVRDTKPQVGDIVSISLSKNRLGHHFVVMVTDSRYYDPSDGWEKPIDNAIACEILRGEQSDG